LCDAQWSAKKEFEGSLEAACGAHFQLAGRKMDAARLPVSDY
jgi:hypothetical protein